MAQNAPYGFRSAREKLGLSQVRLSIEAECSPDYVRMVERGYMPVKPVDSPAFQRICRVLEIEVRGDGSE